jgi:hypothetical protein
MLDTLDMPFTTREEGREGLEGSEDAHRGGCVERFNQRVLK